MKLMRYGVAGVPALGSVIEDGVVDVNTAAPDFLGMLAPAGIAAARALTKERAAVHALNDVQPLLPLAPNARVFCVGQNYVEHIREMGYEIPKYPSIFMRTHESFAPTGAAIVKPRVSDHFDYEGELTVVIGRLARHVVEADAVALGRHVHLAHAEGLVAVVAKTLGQSRHLRNLRPFQIVAQAVGARTHPGEHGAPRRNTRGARRVRVPIRRARTRQLIDRRRHDHRMSRRTRQQPAPVVGADQQHVRLGVELQ